MKERNHLKYVTTAVLKRVIRVNMLSQFMKERNYSIVMLFTTAVFRGVTSIDMLYLCMKEKNPIKVDIF